LDKSRLRVGKNHRKLAKPILGQHLTLFGCNVHSAHSLWPVEVQPSLY
jgi:hypothetical protein